MTLHTCIQPKLYCSVILVGILHAYKHCALDNYKADIISFIGPYRNYNHSIDRAEWINCCITRVKIDYINIREPFAWHTETMERKIPLEHIFSGLAILNGFCTRQSKNTSEENFACDFMRINFYQPFLLLSFFVHKNKFARCDTFAA